MFSKFVSSYMMLNWSFTKGIWIWTCYDEFYKSSHLWPKLSIFWLLMQMNENDEVYKSSIMKLMMFNESMICDKDHSHIMMIDPLWSLMFKNYSYWWCHFVAKMLKMMMFMSMGHSYWLMLYCF